MFLAARSTTAPIARVGAASFEAAKAWLVFTDRGAAGRSSAGGQLALELHERGDRVIKVMHGTEFRELDASGFTIRAGNIEEMRRLMDGVRRQASHLTGIVHLWSLDIETNDEMTNETFASSRDLAASGCCTPPGARSRGRPRGRHRLARHTRGTTDRRSRRLFSKLHNLPCWGLGRVAAAEYRNLRCRLVDLTTCSREEIASLVEELDAADDAEDEIALHGELRYVHRLVPVSPTTLHGMGRQIDASASHSASNCREREFSSRCRHAGSRAGRQGPTRSRSRWRPPGSTSGI